MAGIRAQKVLFPQIGSIQLAPTPTLSILTLSRMTLSKVSFSDILRNDYLDHFDTFGENFDTFKNDTFESVRVTRETSSMM